MNYKMVGRIVSQIMAVEAFFMLPALIIGICRGEKNTVMGFAWTMVILVAVASVLFMICRKAAKKIYAKEGFVCVAFGWIFMSLFGCLPFVISGTIPNYIDALFEIVSGFTTTGASVLSDVESLSGGILYWRSFSHWLGGMGVLVFLLAIAPAGGKDNAFTMHILRAESPGPDVGKLVPRMRKTAGILYVIYVLLTIIDMIFLLAGKMPGLEAVCTALGTAGTGGFGIKNDSMASYSPYIQNVCTVFMLLFGVNFTCYYLLILGHIKEVFKDQELRLYLGFVFTGAIVIAINICKMYDTVGEAVRHAFFQVASIITTTGFSSTDFDLWPTLSKAILVLFMITGGCAGSTSGGLKCGRALLIMKSLRRNIKKMINPQKVQVVRNNGNMVSEKIIENTNIYLVAYVIIIVVSFLLVSVDGKSLTTTFSSVLACFNNIGPGFDQVGPMCNFSIFSPFSKLVLIIDMLAGRLEIFPILILFTKGIWSRK